MYKARRASSSSFECRPAAPRLAAGRGRTADDNLLAQHRACFRIERKRSWGAISASVVERTAGKTICRSNSHQLIYFLNDFRGAIATDEDLERPCVLPSGTFAFLPAGVTSEWYLTSGRTIQILQRPDTYTNLAFDILQERRGTLVPKYGLYDRRVSQIVLAITNEAEHHFRDRFMVDALNIALAVQVSRLCRRAVTAPLAPLNGLSHERLKRVRDYVEAHLSRHVTLTDLASITGLSTYYFSRSFKQAVGVGPQRYVIQRRVERAKTLIRRSNQSLALIAQATGFVDQSHLTSVFRHMIGVTPGRFRASVGVRDSD